MELTYYGDYAQAEQSHWWFLARRRILRSMIDSALGTSGAGAILEVGTGTGAMGQMLSGYGRFVGLDASPKAMEYAKTKLDRLVVGRLEALPFRDQSFDAVFACDVIEHLADDRRALSELRRVCRPGGKLFVTVPAFQFLWSSHDEINHHHRRYTRSRLAAALNDSRWRIERLSYFNTLLFPLIAAARMLTGRGRAGSDFDRRLPGVVNAGFERIFASERHWLQRADFPFGVSLLAIGTPQG